MNATLHDISDRIVVGPEDARKVALVRAASPTQDGDADARGKPERML